MSLADARQRREDARKLVATGIDPSEARKADKASAGDGGGAVAIAGMSWAEFEMLICELFRVRGYSVKETGSGGADGGIDLVAQRDGQTTLVQCKHWKLNTVGVPVAREMLGLMAEHGAAAVPAGTHSTCVLHLQLG